MRRGITFYILTAALVVISLTAPTPAHAASTISNVALSSYSNCTLGGVDLTISTDATAVREAGAAIVNGVKILEFEQPTGLTSFTGTFMGYNYPFPTQPADTMITLTGYIGTTPQTTNTIEWSITYNCTTKAVSKVCFGNYPTCSGGPPGPALPANRNLVLITADTPVLTGPAESPISGRVLKFCQTAFIIETSKDGLYGRVFMMGGWIALANTLDVPEQYGQPGFPVAPQCVGK